MFTVRLTRIRELSDSTRDFRLVREDGERLSYKPGQFYRFTFKDAAGAFERSYSLCNFEDLYSDTLDLVISKVEGGRATRLLFNCELGLTASVKGPYGRLVLPDPLPGRLVLVATSVGIAPYLPMLKALAEPLAGGSKVTLLFGIRDKSEFLYSDLLLDYAQKYPGFDLRVCLSREQPGTAPHEYPGYVTDQLDSLAPDPDQDHFLLCGNPRMVDSCWAKLQQLGFRHKQVIREKYEFAREKAAKPQAMTEEQKQLIAAKLARHQRQPS